MILESQKIRVSRKFSFEMAHALYNYQGPCKNIHGHTYCFCVTLRGFPNHTQGCSDDGMVIDFGNIKRIVREKIIDKFDHALVLNHNAPLSSSKEINGPELISARLDETTNAYAEWYLSDNQD